MLKNPTKSAILAMSKIKVFYMERYWQANGAYEREGKKNLKKGVDAALLIYLLYLHMYSGVRTHNCYY